MLISVKGCDDKWRKVVPFVNFRSVVADAGEFCPLPFLPWWGWVRVIPEKDGKMLFDHETFEVKRKIKHGIVVWIPVSCCLWIRKRFRV